MGGASLVPALHVLTVIVITGNGEAGDEGEEAVEVDPPIAALIQILHYLIHRQGVVLILEEFRELALHQVVQVLLAHVVLVPGVLMEGEHDVLHSLLHL